MPFTQILCPVDFSDASRAALQTAAALSGRFEAPLQLVHIHHVGFVDLQAMAINPLLIVDVQRKIDESLAEWAELARKLGARDVSVLRLEGVPWKAIVSHARGHASDLIVMGTHGHTGLRHAMIGSVAERLVRHAHCPVLVVR